MSDIDVYYERCFREVNYSGLNGLAAKFQHQVLERPFRGQHFSQVLEVGAALGDHLRFVQHSYDRYLMTDLVDRKIDVENLGLATERGEVRFEMADVQSLPFVNDTFDRVLHTCVLHHLSDPEKALSEIRRVLRPGGIATLYLPCDPGFLYMLTQRFTTRRSQVKAIKRELFDFDVSYLRAKEHPGHFSAIRALARHVFREDDVQERYWPFKISLWNFNFFLVFSATKAREVRTRPTFGSSS